MGKNKLNSCLAAENIKIKRRIIMNKNSKKIRTMALALTLCLALVCFAPAVLAQDSTQPNAQNYENLYYFSNKDGANSFFNQIMLSVQNVNNFYFFHIAHDSTLFYLATFNENIETNSLVIFELSTVQLDYCQFLNIIFSDMKQNNCKIMFINGTEEACLLDNNLDYYNCANTDFLDFVDIHINLDIFTIFMDTILADTEIDEWMENTTFILDNSLVGEHILQYIFPDFIDNWYFRATNNERTGNLDFYLLSYFYMLYENTDTFLAQTQLSQLLMNNGIKIFCHLQGNVYLNLLNGQQTDITDYDDFLNEISNEYILAIGTSWKGMVYIQEWLGDLIAFQDSVATYFPIYFFNSQSYVLNGFSAQIFFEAHGTAYFEANILPGIIEDFANDADLSIYDNWYGRCIVTHKPIYLSSNGWLNSDMRILPYYHRSSGWVEDFD